MTRPVVLSTIFTASLVFIFMLFTGGCNGGGSSLDTSNLKTETIDKLKSYYFWSYRAYLHSKL
ncbi:MAG: hypothetical protein D6719_12400 [Candidatus Dadabacteria bacterium]|nr:MAG: hypothetical protein D6719_12400 [Candidatus Dadabacteria bacterium]